MRHWAIFSIGLAWALVAEPILAADATRPIVLGHYASMSGSKAAFGEATDRAIRLAVAEANRDGGILGRHVEVATADDQSSPDQVLPAVLDLIDRRRADVLLGEVASTLTLIGAPVCQERGVPMITPSSVAARITRIGPWIFRVCFTADTQGHAAATFAATDLHARRAAILVDQGSDYALGYAQAFTPAFERLGGEVVGSWSYRDGDRDFKAQLSAIAAAGVDALIVPAMYHDVPGIAHQARQVGIPSPLIGGDGWDAAETVTLGGQAVEGSYFTTHYAPDQPKSRIRQFIKAYRTAYHTDPDAMAALGYDAARLALDAITRAGSTDPAAIREALATTSNFPGVTGSITMGPGRDPSKSVMVLQIRERGVHLVRTIEPDTLKTEPGAKARAASPGRTRPKSFSTMALAQLVLDGLGLGVIYGLIAVGYSIVYGILRLINFAHGDIFMLGPALLVMLAPSLGLAGASGLVGITITLALAMALGGCAGVLLEQLAYRPLWTRPGVGSLWAFGLGLPLVSLIAAWGWPTASPWLRPFAVLSALYGIALGMNRLATRGERQPIGRMSPLISAIGASLFLEALAQQPRLFGNRPRAFPIQLVEVESYRLGPLRMDQADALAFAVTAVALVATTTMIRKTRLGLAMRAVSDRPDVAMLMGVMPDRVIRFAFLLGGGLAGIAGVLWSLKYPTVDPLMGILPGLKAFVAAVLGGIGRLPGAVLGGLIMGLSETLIAASPLSAYKDGLAFALLIGVLLVRPAGLLGHHQPDKV